MIPKITPATKPTEVTTIKGCEVSDLVLILTHISFILAYMAFQYSLNCCQLMETQKSPPQKSLLTLGLSGPGR